MDVVPPWICGNRDRDAERRTLRDLLDAVVGRRHLPGRAVQPGHETADVLRYNPLPRSSKIVGIVAQGIGSGLQGAVDQQAGHVFERKPGEKVRGARLGREPPVLVRIEAVVADQILEAQGTFGQNGHGACA